MSVFRSRPPSPVRRDLRNSTRDAAGWCVMVGLGETYVPAFALASGLGDVAGGLVATVPLVLGALLQVVSIPAVRRAGTLRGWVAGCSVVQALALLPMAGAALGGGMGLVPLFAAATLYWGAGFATFPAWTTWIETLVPRRVRALYFGRRGVLTGAVLLAAILGGGALLQATEDGGRVMAGFALMFLGAALGRGASAWFLSRHREVWTPRCRALGPLEFLRRCRGAPSGRLLAAVVAVQAAVFAGLPFFTPWVLGPLGFSYAAYTTLVAAAFLARMAALPLLARVADRLGPRWLVIGSGLGLVPVAALWVATGGFGALLALQAATGILLGAWELGTFILFLDTIPREERLSVMTWYVLANALAVAAGSLLGGWILGALGPGGGFAVVFLVSTGLRVLCVPLLLRVPAAPGPVQRPALAGLAVAGESPGGPI